MKNSPFGKRLRASHNDSDDEHRRNRQRTVNPIFGVASANTTPSLDSRPSSSDSSKGPDSPVELRGIYADRFVPNRDGGDMRTSYNLMDQPTTPKKSRIIPSESDALKGE